MEGPAFVKWIETKLIQNDISKETFYAESGISTANMTQWRAGDYNPSKKSIEKAERFFESRQKEKSPAPEGAEPFAGYSALTDEEKEKVREFAAFLLASRQKR